MTDQPDRTIPPARPPTAGPSPGPGDRLGSFRLIALVGEGGMGRVFVAEDSRLERRVALKVMKPDAAQDERARKMFLREARSAAAVGHLRIVTIYEAAEADGVPYIAMELLAGEPLDRFLARTPRPPLPVVRAIARQVAEGLHAAHTHPTPLIHRDIKPANVWLKESDAIDVRLLDFGLARAAGGDTLSTGNAGKALGTPLYMAPEQWDGRGVDHQSDIYSLGVVLYQMLTGVPPFQGDSVRELMFQICMPSVVPTPPATLNPTVPADLSAFVLRMMAREKGERVSTAAEVLAELGQPLPTTRPTDVRPVAPLAVTTLARAGERTVPVEDSTPHQSPKGDAMSEPVRTASTKWGIVAVAVGVIGCVIGGALLIPGGDKGKSTPSPEQATAVPAGPTPTEREVAPPPKPPPVVVPNQQIKGNGNIQIGVNQGVQNVTINPKPQVVKKHVLDNDGSGTMVLKEIKNKNNPLRDVIAEGNQWGQALAGTEVEIVAGVEETKSPNPALRFRQVKILEGDLKDKVGWVSSNVIKIVEVTR